MTISTSNTNSWAFKISIDKNLQCTIDIHISSMKKTIGCQVSQGAFMAHSLYTSDLTSTIFPTASRNWLGYGFERQMPIDSDLQFTLRLATWGCFKKIFEETRFLLEQVIGICIACKKKRASQAFGTFLPSSSSMWNCWPPATPRSHAGLGSGQRWCDNNI